MAYTTVDKAKANMSATKFSGTGSSNSITGVNFQPDCVWIKARFATTDWVAFNSLRGTTKKLIINETNIEATDANSLTAFDTDGFTLGSEAAVNTNGNDYIAYCWKGGTTSGITQGSANITPTSYTFNVNAGISFVKYTGNGTTGGSIPHGLGIKPAMVIIKSMTDVNGWKVWHKDLQDGYPLALNTTQATAADSNSINTCDTEKVITQGTHSVNESGETYIMYAFAEKPGFSKAYTFTANGSQPRFIHCNFKPIWWIGKASSNGSESWALYDDKREGYNAQNDRLAPNHTGVEGNETGVDLVSNGIVIRETSNGHLNYSNYTYVGMAFGQSIVGSNNIPATAR